MKYAKNGTAAPPPATGIFKPRYLEVERTINVDEVFQRARRIASGEGLDEVGDLDANIVKGQRAVAIVTPERQMKFDPCPQPGSVPEEEVAEACSLFPRDAALTISAISYTNPEALTADTDMTRTIPFRGFLNMWAYAGHSVMVFEGHPAAFESGVRDCDVLLVDSGMTPFLQFNWADVAIRVMRPGGRIFIHNRDSYSLSLVMNPASKRSTAQAESDYAELLLRCLIRSERSTVEITSGEVLPDLMDLFDADLDWIAKLSAERDKLNPDAVIDILLRKAGWRWYLPFKRSGTLETAVFTADESTMSWKLSVTLGKSPGGKRQLQIER